MGETKMGRIKLSSWTLHTAGIIIFSTLLGNRAEAVERRRTADKWLVALSLFVLVASTAIVGYGNYLGLSSASAD